MGITISVEELAQRINTGSNNIILASLWSPHEGGGYAHFNSEHISTARYCDTAFALASAPSSKLGRNPLPTKDTLARWFIRWGLTDDRQVVVYDDYRGLLLLAPGGCSSGRESQMLSSWMADRRLGKPQAMRL